MRNWVIAMMVLAACKGGDKTAPADKPADKPVDESKAGTNKTTPPANADALGQYEAKTGKEFSGVFVEKTGVWVDRKRIATVDELTSKPDVLTNAIKATDKYEMTVVVLQLHDEPASAVEAALVQIGAAGRGKARFVGPDGTECAANTAQPMPDPDPKAAERVYISTTVLAASIFIGLSRVNEFSDIELSKNPELSLKNRYMELKVSAFFSDRNDIELGAAPDAQAWAYLSAFHAACRAGFINISPMKLEDLSAQVQR